MKATIILTIGIVLLAFVLLSVRILFKKDGRFSSQHIGENVRMKQDGIGCATSQDRQERNSKEKQINVKKV